MTENHKYFEKLVSEIENAVLGNLFGKPCGKLYKKAFVAFFQDTMVFKIGREKVEALLQEYEGAQKWDPSGKNRAMKDWLQVPAEYKTDWVKLTKMAVEFMS